MSKILNRSITINGELLKIDGAQTGLINVLRFDKNGDILEAEGPYAADSAFVGSKHFAKGCIWRNTEGTTGTVLYINDGTAASSAFAGLSTGDITSVVAGAGMTGGGTSGAVTLNVIATDSTVTVAADGIKVATGGITNTEVSASAAIAFSKLAALSDGNILVGSAGNVATSVNPSGDVDVSNTGAFTIAAGAVTNAKVADSTGASALGIRKSATVVYDFAVDGGVAGNIVLTGAPTIPDNAVVWLESYDVITTCTSATDAATIALGFATDGAISTAVAISAGANAWDAGAFAAGTGGTASPLPKKLTAARVPGLVVAGGENLTAGKIVFQLAYWVSA